MANSVQQSLVKIAKTFVREVENNNNSCLGRLANTSLPEI